MHYYIFISRYHFRQKYFYMEIKLLLLELTSENLSGTWSLHICETVCSVDLNRAQWPGSFIEFLLIL